jgi:hypothetical protein
VLISFYENVFVGRYGLVDIPTEYGVDSSGIETGGGEIFLTHGSHLAFYTMGTCSLLVVKWPESGINSPLPSSTEVKERVELCL